MKKRLLSLALAFVMILSLNVTAFASPGGGIVGDPIDVIGVYPLSIYIPVGCPEDCQGEDDDNDN